MAASGNFPDNRQRVLDAVNLVKLVGNTVALKRRGNSYVGLCPFHNEKTPSFNVIESKGIFKCFGCNKGGNAIDFVMLRDRVDFLAALELLARESGIDLIRSPRSAQTATIKQQLLDANSAACRFFERTLADATIGQAAREYLYVKRGFDLETASRFRLGYASEAWEALARSSMMKPFPKDVLLQAGLVKPREQDQSVYDTFRERVIFPIRDEGGRVIAFGGRVMPGSDAPAKYLNSPETPLFSKSRCVFGIDLARQRIIETRTAVIVEGYTDVVMAHQFGCTNVVSVLGTALTEQHVQLLRRFADKIVLLFDADAAGDTAADRSVELFLSQPIEIEVATLPDGLDPDEVLLKQGKAGFESVISSAIPAVDFMWKRMTQQFKGATDTTNKAQAIDQFLSRLSGAKASGNIDELRWGQTLTRVAPLTGLTIQQLNRRFARPSQSNRPVVQSAGGGAPDSAVPKVDRQSGQERAERWVLSALFAEGALWGEFGHLLTVDDFQSARSNAVAAFVFGQLRGEGEVNIHDMLEVLTGESRDFALDVLAGDVAQADAKKLLTDGATFFQNERDRREQSRLTQNLRQTTTGESPSGESPVELLRKLQEQARRPDVRRGGGG